MKLLGYFFLIIKTISVQPVLRLFNWPEVICDFPFGLYYLSEYCELTMNYFSTNFWGHYLVLLWDHYCLCSGRLIKSALSINFSLYFFLQICIKDTINMEELKFMENSLNRFYKVADTNCKFDLKPSCKNILTQIMTSKTHSSRWLYYFDIYSHENKTTET